MLPQLLTHITDNHSRSHRCGAPSARLRTPSPCPTKDASALSCRTTPASPARRHRSRPISYTTCGAAALGHHSEGVIEMRDCAGRSTWSEWGLHPRSYVYHRLATFARSPATIHISAAVRPSHPSPTNYAYSKCYCPISAYTPPLVYSHALASYLLQPHILICRIVYTSHCGARNFPPPLPRPTRSRSRSRAGIVAHP